MTPTERQFVARFLRDTADMIEHDESALGADARSVGLIWFFDEKDRDNDGSHRIFVPSSTRETVETMLDGADLVVAGYDAEMPS